VADARAGGKARRARSSGRPGPLSVISRWTWMPWSLKNATARPETRRRRRCALKRALRRKPGACSHRRRRAQTPSRCRASGCCGRRDAVAGPADLAELLDVDVDQLARSRALIAVGRLVGVGPRQARQPLRASTARRSARSSPGRRRSGPRRTAARAARRRPPRRPRRSAGNRVGHRRAILKIEVAGLPAPAPLTRAALADTGRLGGRRQRPPRIDPLTHQPTRRRTRPGVLMQSQLRVSFGRLQASQPAPSEEARTEQPSCQLQLGLTGQRRAAPPAAAGRGRGFGLTNSRDGPTSAYGADLLRLAAVRTGARAFRAGRVDVAALGLRELRVALVGIVHRLASRLVRLARRRCCRRTRRKADRPRRPTARRTRPTWPD
jgi:hypothetical protein